MNDYTPEDARRLREDLDSFRENYDLDPGWTERNSEQLRKVIRAGSDALIDQGIAALLTNEFEAAP